MEEKKVCIIGGGFCGTMTAIHLLSQTNIPVHITLVNSGYPLTKGVAYSSYSNKHLLNVAVKNMSAFPDKPAHFADWIRKHETYGAIDPATLPEMFLPRNIYGHYLKDIFDDAIRKKQPNVSISFVHDEAIDMETKENKLHVYFSVSPAVVADKVLLATGNQLPARPHLEDNSFYSGRNYFGNPWLHEAVSNLDPDKEVLIIGNGLTMVDVVIGLLEKNHKGKIYSISPHGFRILPHHVSLHPYTDLINDLTPPHSLVKLVGLFRKHIRRLRSEGYLGDALVSSLRPLAQKIWLSWSKTEKKRFLHFIRPLWDPARHRLPLQIHYQLQQLILDDKLEIIAGHLLNIEEAKENIRVTYRRRKDGQNYVLQVSRIINCTGPQGNISQMRMPLIENLISRKLICADEMNLGMRVKENGAIISADGKESSHLYTIGSNMKGTLWETTAIIELRQQAKNMAALLLE